MQDFYIPSIPINPSNGQEVLNEAYGDSWATDIVRARTAKNVYDKIESMGYIGEVVFVDNLYGDDDTGQPGNILKPYKTHAFAAGMLTSIATGKSAVVTLPGNYNFSNAFGFPLITNIDHIIIDSNITQTGFAYGTFMSFPSSLGSVKILGIGSVNFISNSSNSDWSMITPYQGCNIEFTNINFQCAKQFIGQQGSIAGINVQLKFSNCRIVSSDNIVNPVVGGGFIQGSAYFKDCYFKGHLSVYNSTKSASQTYKTKWVDCEIEAPDVAVTSGEITALGLFDYASNAETIQHVFDRCKFVSVLGEAIEIGEGFGGIGTNKSLIVQNCDFITPAGGWIKNEHNTATFYLRNNWTRYNASGTYPVTNVLTGTGVITDVNLPNY
ncbi:MAG: hypothetical protein MUE72_11570 [Chitinophagaceae bacterium]|jgi:hypothetical protein|nr:hypothetical protein [Chitinophagaceae bacterium]